MEIKEEWAAIINIFEILMVTTVISYGKNSEFVK